jgi:TRAP-type C4-dicarboxylate transport system substrate-binding protein
MTRFVSRRIPLALTALAALTLAGCAGGESPAAESGSTDLEDFEPITLIYSTALPETNVQGSAEAAFMDYIEDKTEGKVTFERYFASALAGSTEGLDAVQSGLADIAYGIPTFNAAELPIYNWALGLGALAGDDSSSFGQIQKTLAFTQFVAEQDIFDEEYAELGVKPLTPYTQDNAGPACNEPVLTPEDASHKTVSVTPTWTAEAAAAGFTTTYLPTAELYEGLQRGVIDCFYAPLGGQYSINVYEVAPYFSSVGATTAVSLTRPMMNLEKWDELPTEIQQIFDAASVYAIGQFLTRDLETNKTIAEAGEDGDGFTIEVAPDIAAIVAEVQGDAIAELPSKAPEGVDDPDAIIASYTEILADWGTTLKDLGATVVDQDEFVEGLLLGPDQPVDDAVSMLAEKLGLTL